jgi:hypothetical protein
MLDPEWSCTMSNPENTEIRETNARAAEQSKTEGGEAISPMQADHHSTVDPAVETPVEGRQGFLGRPVLAVLVGGLLLVGVAWLIVHYAVR